MIYWLKTLLEFRRKMGKGSLRAVCIFIYLFIYHYLFSMLFFGGVLAVSHGHNMPAPPFLILRSMETVLGHCPI